MRWGVRRFQNADGSLTKEGEARYGKWKLKSRYKVKFQSPFEKQKAKLEKKEQRMTEKEEIVRRKNQLKERQANLKDQGKSKELIKKENPVDTNKKKRAKDLSDQELRDFINRYELEAKYNRIVNGPDQKKGSDVVKEILMKSATTVATKYTTKAMESAIEGLIKKSRNSSSGGSGGS